MKVAFEQILTDSRVHIGLPLAFVRDLKFKAIYFMHDLGYTENSMQNGSNKHKSDCFS